MTSFPFIIKEHLVEGQHVREYARATSTSQEEVLHLCVKQYIPKDNSNPQLGDVTFIGAHANGFPKELYEPLWEELHSFAKLNNFRIRSLWIADVAWQGQSGIFNHDKLGNDPCWLDHARDLLHLSNHFRAEMPRPIVGIGHSFGGTIITNLALLHPRLLSTIILLDPVMEELYYLPGPLRLTLPGISSRRQETWPSRAVAAKHFRRAMFCRRWDPRVLDRWIEFGLRDVGNDGGAEEGVTLSTSKHQEVFTFIRPSWPAYDELGKKIQRPELVPDLDLSLKQPAFPVYRPEGPNTFLNLPALRPSVLYILGGESNVSTVESRQAKLQSTGTGRGGSGGHAKARVANIELDGQSHLLPMEVPQACAMHASKWIGKEIARWRDEQAEYEAWAKSGQAEKSTLSDEWMKRLESDRDPRNEDSKL